MDTVALTKGLDEKFCCECRSVIKAKAELCVFCGCRQLGVSVAKASDVKTTWTSDRPHPWRRYFARMFDSTINGSIVAILIGAIFYVGWPNEADKFYGAIDHVPLLDKLLTLLLSIPLTAFLVGVTGGTLGKWLFGINVHRLDGKSIGVSSALYREILVWFKGMGCGIPVVALWPLIAAYSKLSKTGETSWDKSLGVRIQYRPDGLRQAAGAIVGVLLWLVTLGGLNMLVHLGQVADIPKATVKLTDDRQVEINGAFGTGTAEELRRVLDTSPNVRFVKLESETGGLVDEGLSVYDLIRLKHLSTFTQIICVSACTIAYMGGERRYLGEKGSLQFHQWELFGSRADRDSNMARRMLMAAGVSNEFADKAFAHHELWAPDRATLISAGVVTHSMDGKPYR